MSLGASVAVAILGSLLPPAAIMAAAWWWLFDRVRPALYWTAFGFGAAAVLAAAMLQIPLLFLIVGTGNGAEAQPAMALFLTIVSAIEEAAKFAAWFAVFLIFRRPMTERPGLCVGVAVIAAVTLAAIENLLFNVGITVRQQGVFWEMLGARALTSVPLHATTGLIIGLFAWRVFARRRRGAADWAGLIALPVLLHAGFNLIQIAGGVPGQQEALLEIDAAQWAAIAAAGAIVWVAAGLALAWFARARRRARRRQGAR